MSRSVPADPLHKGRLSLRQHGIGVELEVLEGVFAGAAVDAGTTQLLRRLAEERFRERDAVLDLGCGYGPLGLWLAAARPGRRVLAVDRDARAVAATRAGAERNRLALVEAAGSLGYDDVGTVAFDLVVSNIPAKVGPAALDHLLLDAVHHLAPGGLVAVVVIDRLAGPVGERLAAPGIDVVASFPTRTYTTWAYGFTGIPEGASTEPGFGRGVYRRDRRTFEHGRWRWQAEVSWSIAEFDELGHGTAAALDLLDRPDEGLLVVDGVGQGHLPLAMRAGGWPGTFRLVDRDLLALRQTDANLGGGTDLRHRPRLGPEDLDGAVAAVVALPEREPVAVTAALLGEALRGADLPVVLHGRTTDVHRVLELLPRHGVRRAVAAEVKRRSHRAVRTAPR